MLKFELDKAAPEFQPIIQRRIIELTHKYPEAKLTRVYVGTPRKPKDISMGYYDEHKFEIWFNDYWMSKPDMLVSAAKAQPHFHGEMIDEPIHVITHEFGHALELGLKDPAARMKKIWLAATKDPKKSPAQYGLVNETEYWAELFTACELGLANEDQLAQARYVLEG